METMAEAEAERERAELADFLSQLRPEDWDRESLCAGWRIRDVLAHVVSYEELDKGQLVQRAVKGRFSPDRINALGVAESVKRGPEELVGFLRAHLRPTGITAARGGGVGLVDAVIHHQDVRRPLRAARTIPPERLAFALRFSVVAPPLRGFWHARGVRLVATDVDWSWGRGPEARGPGEAVLMALTGRRGAAADLTGPGAEVLLRRTG